MKHTLHSIIGSTVLISLTLPVLHSQTSTPAAAPAEAPATAPAAAPAAAPVATPVAKPAPATPVAKTSTKKSHLDKKVARVSAAVGLDADQQVKLKAVYVEEEKQISVVKADKSLTSAQETAKVTSIKDAADLKVIALLTPEQKPKYEEYKHHKTPAAAQ